MKDTDTVADLKIRLREAQRIESRFNTSKNDSVNIAKCESDVESTNRVSQKIIQIADESLVSINLETEDKLSQIEFLINSIIKMRNMCIEEIAGSQERLAAIRTTISDKIMIKNSLSERVREIESTIEEIQRLEKEIDSGEKHEIRRVGNRPEKLRNIRSASRENKD